MHCYRVIGLMTVDTERGVENMTVTGSRMIDMEMSRWRLLIPVAIEAVDFNPWGQFGVVDHIIYVFIRFSWIRVAGQASSVMAGSAAIDAVGVGGQDICPIQDRMAVGTVLRVGLGTIGGDVDFDDMFDAAAGAMVMCRKPSGMTADTLAATSNSWRDEFAVSGVVAGGASLFVMDFASADEG